MDFDPKNAAARLSRGQISCIQCMDEKPVILGCAEETAKRLSRSYRRRPALVTVTGSGDDRRYALNAAGIAVKAALGLA